MTPRTTKALVLAAPLLLLIGCGEEPPAVVEEVSRPVKTLLVEAPETGGVRNFPARIDANRKAELAFRVAGKVQDLLVKEGDRVEKDQTVAKLDPKDFQIVANDRKASYTKALRNFDRGKELIKENNISQMDYDRLEAEFKKSKAGLEAAQQDLSYTTLMTPFAGMIARRHIQRFEEVQAKQTVLSLQDVDSLEVKFDVPESVIRGIQASKSDRAERRAQVKVFASFDDLPGQQFPLTFREVATKADPQTQTFETTFTMAQVENATVLPGMTATVTLDLSQFSDIAAVFSVPVSAVVGDYKLDPRVWVVDEESMTVKPQPVKVGTLLGNNIEITEGIEEGSRIVTAGTPFLVEDMKVTLMAEPEQAEPRPEDLKHQ